MPGVCICSRACYLLVWRRRGGGGAHAVDIDISDVEGVVEPSGARAEAEALQLQREASFAPSNLTIGRRGNIPGRLGVGIAKVRGRVGGWVSRLLGGGRRGGWRPVV